MNAGDIPGGIRFQAAPGPHGAVAGPTLRRVMFDVLVGLVPVAVAACYLFRWAAAQQMLVAAGAAIGTEALCEWARGRRPRIGDGSALITGLILAFSLPPSLPPAATALGAAASIGLGKMVFGGLGQNVFNPAMVGRAVLAASFPALMGTWTEPSTLHAVTGATPLAAARFEDVPTDLGRLVTGEVPGSLGETSAIAIVLGGAWILARRAGDWRPTAAMLGTVAGVAAAQAIVAGRPVLAGASAHLASGAALLTAFFIVTDPVTSPLSRSGRWIFGAGVGALTMAIRLVGGYPEGAMYAVLVLNAFVPLLDRWTRPVPTGGHVPAGAGP